MICIKRIVFSGIYFFFILTNYYFIFKNYHLFIFLKPSIIFYSFINLLFCLGYLSLFYSYFLICKVFNFEYLKDYYKYLITDFISFVFFIINLFLIKDLFATFIFILTSLISTILLYYESKFLYKLYSLFILPNIFIKLYAAILVIIIHFMNL